MAILRRRGRVVDSTGPDVLASDWSWFFYAQLLRCLFPAAFTTSLHFACAVIIEPVSSSLLLMHGGWRALPEGPGSAFFFPPVCLVPSNRISPMQRGSISLRLPASLSDVPLHTSQLEPSVGTGAFDVDCCACIIVCFVHTYCIGLDVVYERNCS